MFLVFIDESGKPDIGNKNPYIVCALMIRDSDFLMIEDRIDEIISNELGVYNPRSIEIHGKDLFQNKRIYKMFTIDKRKRLADSVSDFIEQELRDKAKVVLSVFEKHSIPRKNKDYARRRMVKKTYQCLMERIAWMVREWGPEFTLLLNDQSDLDSDIEDTVRYEILQGIYTSTIIDQKYFIKTPLFVDSKDYRALQLADFIAYIYGRIHKNSPLIAGGYFDMRIYFNKILPIIRTSPNGKIEGYGIKVWRE